MKVKLMLLSFAFNMRSFINPLKSIFFPSSFFLSFFFLLFFRYFSSFSNVLFVYGFSLSFKSKLNLNRFTMKSWCAENLYFYERTTQFLNLPATTLDKEARLIWIRFLQPGNNLFLSFLFFLAFSFFQRFNFNLFSFFLSFFLSFFFF